MPIQLHRSYGEDIKFFSLTPPPPHLKNKDFIARKDAWGSPPLRVHYIYILTHPPSPHCNSIKSHSWHCGNSKNTQDLPIQSRSRQRWQHNILRRRLPANVSYFPLDPSQGNCKHPNRPVCVCVCVSCWKVLWKFDVLLPVRCGDTNSHFSKGKLNRSPTCP